MQIAVNQTPANVYFLGVEKIKAFRGGILAALMHNKRELPSLPHIDSSLSHQNYDLNSDKSSSEIAIYASQQMLMANIVSPRSNQVLALEIVFSLPKNWPKRKIKPFFQDCFIWVKNYFGCEVLSFDVHLDERAPHAHALILPLLNGKMQGSKLVGYRGDLLRLHNSFYQNVAGHHGLSKPIPKRKNAGQKQIVSRMVFKALSKDQVRKSQIWEWLRLQIKKDPFSCANFLGLNF